MHMPCIIYGPIQSPNDVLQNSVLRGRYDDKYSEHAITVCSGLDMVNINLNHFVFKDRETSEVWKHGLRKLTNSVKINNVCPTTALEKQ